MIRPLPGTVDRSARAVYALAAAAATGGAVSAAPSLPGAAGATGEPTVAEGVERTGSFGEVRVGGSASPGAVGPQPGTRPAAPPALRAPDRSLLRTTTGTGRDPVPACGLPQQSGKQG